MPTVDLGKIIPTINGKEPVNGTLSLNTNDIPYDETDTAKSKIDKMDAAAAAHLAEDTTNAHVIGNITGLQDALDNAGGSSTGLEAFAQGDGPIVKRVSTVAVADGGHSSDYYTYDHLNNDKKLLSGNTDRLGAWVTSPTQVNDENNPYIEVELPFGVVTVCVPVPPDVILTAGPLLVRETWNVLVVAFIM